jgi:hypothetical protein
MLAKEDRFFDKTINTPANYAEVSFNICIAVRALLGLLIITGNVGRWFILALCAIILYVFISKGGKVGNSTWKYYNRIVISYSAIALLQIIPSNNIEWVNNNKELNELLSEIARRSAGAILIADSLIGFNVRDIFNKLSD